jgi:hypothetical protein
LQSVSQKSSYENSDTNKGFERSGIFPYNAYIIKELCFLTAAATNRPEETASPAVSSSCIEQYVFFLS